LIEREAGGMMPSEGLRNLRVDASLNQSRDEEVAQHVES
jgi:hypothetical protein